MNKDHIYRSPQTSNDAVQNGVDKKQAPLYWTRMLRYSIYFTILGVILSVLLVLVGMSATENPTDTNGKVESMISHIDRIIFSSKFLMMFLIMGVSSIIISLLMRRKEKKLRD